MKKYAITFYILAIILLVTSALTLISSVQITWENTKSRAVITGEIEFLSLAQTLIFSIQQIIYPIVMSVFCLFIARLIKIFEDPEISKKTLDFIHSLRSAGQKHD